MYIIVILIITFFLLFSILIPLGILYVPRTFPEWALKSALFHQSSLPKDYSFESTDVAFESSPGVMLRGWFITPKTSGAVITHTALDGRQLSPGLVNLSVNQPPNGATILVVHGHGSSRTRRPRGQASIFEKVAIPLLQAGYHILTFDLHNHGTSDQSGPITFGLSESRDVIAALSYLQDVLCSRYRLDPRRVGVYAESMGAASSIMALGRHAHLLAHPVRALFSDGAYRDFRTALFDRMARLMLPSPIQTLVWHSLVVWGKLICHINLEDAAPVNDIHRLGIPVLLAQSSEDVEVTLQNGLTLYHQLQSKSPQSIVDFFQNQQAHTETYLDHQMPQRAIHFFQTHLFI